MAHGGQTEFEWREGTPKWDSTRQKVWLCWKWYDAYWTPNLDHFEIKAEYTYKDANGGIQSEHKDPETLSNFAPGQDIFNYFWEVPTDCVSVKFSIQAIAKTHQENGNTVPWFEDDPWYSSWFYCGSAIIPDTPSAPSITRDTQIGNQIVLGLENVYSGEPDDPNRNVTHVEFQTIVFESSNDSGRAIQSTVKAGVDEFGNARHLVIIGTQYGYKFRCRLCGTKDKDENGKWIEPIEVFSEWSDLTEEMVLGIPEIPKLEIRKFTDTTIEYNITIKASHDHYQIQSAESTSAFDNFDEWERLNPQFKENSEERSAAMLRYGIVNERSVNISNGYFTVASLEAGRCFWRVRSVSAQTDGFYSTWCEPVELIFGASLRAPIVQMGQVYATLEDPSVQLRIMHNSPNGTPTCRCDIYLGINATAESAIRYYTTIRPSDMTVSQENNGHYTYYYNLNIQDLKEKYGLTSEFYILWMAYTYEGNTLSEETMEQRSPRSEVLTLWVYEKPSITLRIDTGNTEEFDYEDALHRDPQIIPGFPIHYITTTNLYDKKVISWVTRIVADDNYYGTGKYGERIVIKKGDVLYNKVNTTTPDDLDERIMANEVTLYNGVVYHLEVIASINTGTVVTAGAYFKVDMPVSDFIVECLPSYDFDHIALGLLPSAVKYEGGGFDIGYPDMEIVDEAFHYIPELEEGFPDTNDGAFKYNDETNRITISSVREGGIMQDQDMYAFYVHAFDPDTGDLLPGSIVDMFAEANNMTVAEFTSFCKTNRLWIASTKVKASLNRDDGYFDIGAGDGFYVPSVFMMGMNYQGGGDGMNNIPLLDNTWRSYEQKEYVVGQEYECNGYRETEVGLTVLTTTALGVSLMSIYGDFDEYFNGDYPIVLDPWLGVMMYNPDYMNAQDDATSFYVEYSLMQNARVTAEYAEQVSAFEPYVGEFFMDAEQALEHEDFKYIGDTYVNENMTTTISVPSAGGESEPRRILVNDVSLSVYRKNDDGTFVTIAENVQNEESAFVTDPHPTLNGSEYRIVATDLNNGTVTFYDTQPYDMKCTDIIIQWDEDYADIPYNNDPNPSLRDMGNMIRLPYNIDVSDSGNIDNSMVNYIGRKNPVSYYGTQTGFTSTWNTEIPKYDKQTIAMLRKLQVYPGDVYVREPNGTGYWAHVTVTFPINHCALTVSVSLNVTRVEGEK